jgi:hypothetical protein
MNAALRIYPAPRQAPMHTSEILNAPFICRHKEERIFFSEEKKQKTFANSGPGAA